MSRYSYGPGERREAIGKNAGSRRPQEWLHPSLALRTSRCSDIHYYIAKSIERQAGFSNGEAVKLANLASRCVVATDDELDAPTELAKSK